MLEFAQYKRFLLCFTFNSQVASTAHITKAQI